jgi:hypothetical protein
MQWFSLAFCMIVFRHTVGILWTSDQSVAETSTYTGQHNIETQETNIHALSGIQTRDPSNQAAAYLRLRPRGYRGLLFVTVVGLLDYCYVKTSSVALDQCGTTFRDSWVDLYNAAKKGRPQAEYKNNSNVNQK